MRPATRLIFFYGKIKGQLLRVFLAISTFNLSPGQANVSRAFRKCLRLISFVRTYASNWWDASVSNLNFAIRAIRTISICLESERRNFRLISAVRACSRRLSTAHVLDQCQDFQLDIWTWHNLRSRPVIECSCCDFQIGGSSWKA